MKLIFDSSVLGAFARAGLLEELKSLTANHERFVPRAVLDELSAGIVRYPAMGALADCEWLVPVALESLPELRVFSHYAQRLVGGGIHNVGEAAVLAWAEIHGAVALLDDQAAVQCGRERGVTVRRTLFLLINAIQHRQLTESDAEAMLSRLVEIGGARFPVMPGGLIEWARQSGLLVG